MKDTTDSIEPLISALRQELEHYGEMLALLDRQQEQVKARSAAEIFESISLIQAQAGAIQEARQHRGGLPPDRLGAVRRFDPPSASRLPAPSVRPGG